jgi:hypothetical protein
LFSPGKDGVLLVEFGITDHTIEICKKDIFFESSFESVIWSHAGKTVIILVPSACDSASIGNALSVLTSLH